MSSSKQGEVGQPLSICDEQWHSFKPLLRQKYLFENLTLLKIQNFMLEAYNFHASINQYQRKFNKWRFRKNRKRTQCEDIVRASKRHKLDIDQIVPRGSSAFTSARFRRALHRYNIPKILDEWNVGGQTGSQKLTCFHRTSHSLLKSPITSPVLSGHRDVRILSLVDKELQCLDALPFLSFAGHVNKHLIGLSNEATAESVMISKSFPGLAATHTDIQAYLLSMVAYNPTKLPHNALDTVLYQVSNGMLEAHEIMRLLYRFMNSGLEYAIRILFRSRLHTARAFSEAVLQALIDHIPAMQRPSASEMFDCILNSILWAGIDVNQVVGTRTLILLDIFKPRQTLLQRSLLDCNIDVAMCLLEAGADINYCGEHGDHSTEKTSSCCEMLPTVLLAERVTVQLMVPKSDIEQSPYNAIADLWETISRFEPKYCEDISLSALSSHHSIMRVLIDRGLKPDNIRRWGLRKLCSDHLDGLPESWLTALQNAVYTSDQAAIAILLEAGADASGFSYKSVYETISILALRPLFEDVAVKVHRCLRTRWAIKPLSIACFNGDLEIIQLLLRYQAAINGCQLDLLCEKPCSEEANHHKRLQRGEHRESESSTWVKMSTNSLLAKLKDKLYHQRPEFLRYDIVYGCAPLQMAIVASRHNAVEYLLENGANLEGCHGLTPLALAVVNSDHSIIGMLLKRGADPYGLTIHSPYVSPLAVAAYFNNVEVMTMLMSAHTASTKTANGINDLDLWLAALHKNAEEALSFLLRAKSDFRLCISRTDQVKILERALCSAKETFVHRLVDTLDLPYCSELQEFLETSVKRRSISLVRKFLTIGASANDASVLGQALLISDSTKTDDNDFLQVLLKDPEVQPDTILDSIMLALGKKPHLHLRIPFPFLWKITLRLALEHWLNIAKPSCGLHVYTTLEVLLDDGFRHSRILENQCDLALLLLQHGQYGHNRKKKHRNTPLQLATRRRRLDLVQRLVYLGADVNECAPELENSIFGDPLDAVSHHTVGLTALQHAVWNLDFIMTQYLISQTADVNAAGSSRGGATALQLAVAKRNIAMVNLLLHAGADVNAEAAAYRGRTALQFGVEVGNIDMIELLLSNGASVNSAGSMSFGRTALQLAAQAGKADLVRLLIERGADVNWPAAMRGGVTALQAAAIGGFFDVCHILLAAGAEIDAEGSDVEGRTAVEGAAEHGRLDILKWLLDVWVRQSSGQEAEYRLILKSIKKARHYAEENCKWFISEFLCEYAQNLKTKLRSSSDGTPHQQAQKPDHISTQPECPSSTESSDRSTASAHESSGELHLDEAWLTSCFSELDSQDMTNFTDLLQPSGMIYGEDALPGSGERHDPNFKMPTSTEPQELWAQIPGDDQLVQDRAWSPSCFFDFDALAEPDSG